MAGDGSVLEVLDAAALRAWAHQAAVRLRAARADLDDLNVFPVPDGDTGTNLLLTLEGALASGEPDLARALLVSARGSSGVILSQLVRGWADVLTGAPVADAAALAKALRRGDDLAWQAVSEPVEGTVLSVSRAAAGAAAAAAEGGADLGATVALVLRAAGAALARTTEQLPALSRAGVVDAGGAGLVVVLEALDGVVRGAGPGPGTAGTKAPRGPRPLPAEPAGTPGYEVMYLLQVQEGAAPDEAAGLRRTLAALGDSVVVAGSGSLWSVHVHTDRPGAAVDAGIDVGRPRDVRTTSLVAAPGTHPAAAPRVVGVVACAAGDATEAVCRQAGAVVVRSAPAARASTGDVLHAVLRAGAYADRVLVLPNDAETAAVARQAVLGAAESGVRAQVLPSRSQVQVLAALAVLDPEDAGSPDAAAAAVAGCRYGALTVATRDAPTAAGPCRAGNALGTVADEVVVVRPDLTAAACDLVDLLLADGGELLTLVPGADAGEAPDAVRRHLGSTRPDVDVAVVGGGQARYPLLVGCE